VEFYLRGNDPYASQSIEEKTAKLEVNLDALLDFSTIWQWSATDMENKYVPKLENQGQQQKSPQFEWMSASKDRARFSRHMLNIC